MESEDEEVSGFCRWCSVVHGCVHCGLSHRGEPSDHIGYYEHTRPIESAASWVPSLGSFDTGEDDLR